MTKLEEKSVIKSDMILRTKQTNNAVINSFLFCPFEEPSSRKSATNDISFESPDTELSEFIKKLGVASSRGRHCPIN